MCFRKVLISSCFGYQVMDVVKSIFAITYLNHLLCCGWSSRLERQAALLAAQFVPQDTDVAKSI